MTKTILEIETVQSGQPRAYADSFYEAYISCRVEGMLLNNWIFYRELNEDFVKSIARLLVRPFDDKPADWASAVLKTCAPVGPTPEMIKTAAEKWIPKQNTRWHILIVEAFTD